MILAVLSEMDYTVIFQIAKRDDLTPLSMWKMYSEKRKTQHFRGVDLGHILCYALLQTLFFEKSLLFDPRK